MRSFTLSIVLLILLGICFAVGLVTTQAAPMLISFCASPFIMLAIGWTARGLLAGRRVALVEVEQRRPQPQRRQQPQRQQIPDQPI